MSGNLLVINVDIREIRVALIEQGVIAELHIERLSSRSTLGNIYLGKVSRVLPGMQAAFIDIGQPRAAFLHVEDLIRPEDFETYMAKEPVQAAAAPDAEASEETGDEAKPPARRGRGRGRGRGHGRGRSAAKTEAAAASGDSEALDEKAQAEDQVSGDAQEEPVEATGVEDSDSDTEMLVGGATSEPGAEPSAASQAGAEDDEIEIDVDEEGEENEIGSEDGSDEEESADAEDDVEEEGDEDDADEAEEDDAADDEDDEDDEEDAEDDAEDLSDDEESEDDAEHSEEDGELEIDVDVEDDGDDEEDAESEDESEEDGEPELAGDAEEDAEPSDAEPATADDDAGSEEATTADESSADDPSGEVAQAEGVEPGPDGAAGPVAEDGSADGGGELTVPREARGRRRRRGRRARTSRSSRETNVKRSAKSTKSTQANQRQTPNARQSASGGKKKRMAARRGRSRKKTTEQKSRIPKNTPIRDVVREGQQVVVQVTKEPIGTKGARVSSHVSLPGRYVVYLPTVETVGISKRIGSDKERSRLRAAIESVKPPKGGLVVRTASEGLTKKHLKNDVGYLIRLWAEIGKKRDAAGGGAPLLYEELDLVMKTARDLFTEDVGQIVIDNREQYGRLRRFVGMFLPERVQDVHLYEGREPVFDAYGIEDEIGRALSRKVPLPSGGYLIIDQAEALTAIDVNTGRYVGKGSKDLEDTIYATNIEAVQEIAYQLRFRNLGGLIILDLIDMERASNREKVRRKLEALLAKDKAKTTLNRISDLGLIEMTRKRTRESLMRVMHEPCFYCDGTGQLMSRETIAYEILRQIRREQSNLPGYQITVNAHPAIVDLLKSEEREAVQEAERMFARRIILKSNDRYHIEQFDLEGI